MDYKQTLEYLYAKLPMFTRIGAVAFKKDLHNTIILCDHLGNPQDKFKSIHIGGTNGKGSTSHMLAAILQQAGYKTGLYTSPHLKDFRERIRIDGKMIPESYVTQFVEQQKNVIEEIAPSFFEVTVAMAFDYFAKEKVDIAVIEVGLGGRLDSTNIITPELSIITNISLDHTNLLGNTVKEIAYEKAGIIKNGVPVIIGESGSEADEVFLQKSKETESPISFASKNLKIERSELLKNNLSVSISKNGELLYEDLSLDLTGAYQKKNILTVVNAVEELIKLGYDIEKSDVHKALLNVTQITGLQGRWQILGNSPTIICDTGHNAAGIEEIVNNLSGYQHDTLHMVIGMVKDKDISTVLKLLPPTAIYYFCSPDLERALAADQLREQALQAGLKGNAYPSVKHALEAAKSSAKTSDLIFIGGSTFVVAEIL
ncbi:MAG: bifunctional folylpolyglutamate synthase/dihydrofolate synthase [Pedobacter sp.]|nr:MAG: bifunctional folylpolyglutamate synthase/dihydrofolate synthase [Pedobacter sp.]